MTSASRNIAYRTSAIAEYFGVHRIRWDQFYPSERWILDRLAEDRGIRRVLDVGCAVGGLGLALQDRFPIDQYVGVEINEEAVSAARARVGQFRCPVDFHSGDILEMTSVEGGPFDLVTNLSCSDWNIETAAITTACWRHVAPGGSLVISLRLTDGPSLNDFSKSYQFIRYDGDAVGTDEKANYVVLNVNDALRMLETLEPAPTRVVGYGYWGAPSSVAVTPYSHLVFAVFAVTKPASGTLPASPPSELHFPLSLWTGTRP